MEDNIFSYQPGYNTKNTELTDLFYIKTVKKSSTNDTKPKGCKT